MASISRIDDIYVNESGTYFVTAIIEDVVITRLATRLDPEEYGPAKCEVAFELEEDEVFPMEGTENEQIAFLESLDLMWDLVEPEDDF